MKFENRTLVIGAVALTTLLISALHLLHGDGTGGRDTGNVYAAQGSGSAQAGNSSSDDSVGLNDTQLKSVSIIQVAEREFTIKREAVGTIDFNEDVTVQVSPPNPGRVVQLFARAGDRVEKGKVLFTIDSPDLVQAESTLISTAGVRELTSSVLRRAKELYAVQGLAQKDYEQAVSDQQTAEGAFKAARDAVRIFGKTETEIDKIVEDRRIDSRMPVPSPVSGLVTARNAALGTLVQPGATPAPYTVADISTKWMLANVPEADMPSLHLGQEVDVKLLAYPGRTYHGKITNIGASIDPNTHRVTVRSEVRDPGDELHPQMFATFTVHTGGPVRSLAVPYGGVVREGDGTMTVWATTDRRRFTQRTVQLGLQQDGYDQILEGLKAGELIAGEGALFISNARILAAK